MTRPPVRIACTLGDPNGIGPEVVFKALRDETLCRSCTMEFILLGPGSVLAAEFGRAALERGGVSLHGIRVVLTAVDTPANTNEPAAADASFTAEPGRLSAEAGQRAMWSVERAVDLCLAGEADAIVTAPISKEAVHLGGYAIPGHTEFLAARTGAAHVTMMLVSDDLRVAVATGHIPLSSVATALSTDLVLTHLHTIDHGLRTGFAVASPRIAVLGLNPHAGDGGVLGTEEAVCIEPAIERARAEGIDARGPFPADGFFGSGSHGDVDCILAMYHDQGLAPFKALSFGRGVNVTLGLPFVRTSPDHGTAFGIAGRGVARADSTREAIRTACHMTVTRL
ncbi:MAG: 4-hydroxythreonine-4-phosphate dehydrogenase PdxA [Bacteroidetes bacterium CG12_big_fil_rev_8_21_14_0_65_60_17]|nr:MAG: 4-hydroxythreonine-4-phosphate dehydrogenase PdxA [Bacteroidetes bacterium CG12_big_fil_rev_8_21_14_0_65_60_17]